MISLYVSLTVSFMEKTLHLCSWLRIKFSYNSFAIFFSISIINFFDLFFIGNSG
jgi:hypothetical protein